MRYDDDDDTNKNKWDARISSNRLESGGDNTLVMV